MPCWTTVAEQSRSLLQRLFWSGSERCQHSQLPMYLPIPALVAGCRQDSKPVPRPELLHFPVLLSPPAPCPLRMPAPGRVHSHQPPRPGLRSRQQRRFLRRCRKNSEASQVALRLPPQQMVPVRLILPRRFRRFGHRHHHPIEKAAARQSAKTGIRRYCPPRQSWARQR